MGLYKKLLDTGEWEYLLPVWEQIFNDNIYAPNINWAPTETATLLTSKWGALICIDSATGELDKTTNWYVEDIKYWISVGMFSDTVATRFTELVKRTWKFTIQTNVTVSAWTYSKPITVTWIIVKPSTKYKISLPIKHDIVYTSGNWRKFVLDQINSSWAWVWDYTIEAVTASTDWHIATATFTTLSTCVELKLYQFNYLWTTWKTYWDWNAFKLEEIVETSNDTLTSKSAWLLWFTANWTYDNIDQSQLTITGAYPIWDWSRNFAYQQIVPQKNNFVWIVFQKLSSIWVFTWDILFKIRWDTADNPNSTIYSTYTVPNATWNWYANSIDIQINLPFKAVAWTKYWIEISATTSDAVNYARINANSANWYTSWLNKYSNTDLWTLTTYAWDIYFKTLYYKPCTNLQASLNWDKIDLRADSDWFLDWAKIDLVNWTWSWNWWFTPSNYDILWKSNSIDYTVWAWNITSGNRLFAWSTWAYFIYKLPDWVKNIKTTFSSTVSWGSQVDIFSSPDNITYTKFVDNVFSVNLAPCIDWTKYIKIVSKWNNTKLEQIAFFADYVLLNIKTLYNFPTNKVISNIYSKVCSIAVTTAIYRRTKFWFPAIEFSNWEYVLLKVNCEDTTSTVKFSADWTTFTTVADWDSIAITSTTIPIVYTQITIPKNRLLLSSNDYNADWTKDWSNCQTVKYVNKQQGLIYDIADLQKEINLLKS